MEKSWDQIRREVDAMHAHQDFSEKLILVLFAASMLAGLLGAPKPLTFLFLIPTFGYMIGRYAVETLHGPFRDYWFASLGSQAALAFMVGVPLLIRFGF